MAYLAQLSASIGELVEAVAEIPESQHERRQACREAALRGVRHHSFGRTNQFEVEDRLHGLEERFRIIGRDLLADALRERLDALEPLRNKHSPDVLHFILELADQPAQKANLAELDRLREPEEEKQPPLTWRQIAKEEGWNQEREIWQCINYALSSDDDDDDVRSAASTESLTTASSVDGRLQRTAHDLLIDPLPAGKLLIERVDESQGWRQTAAFTTNGNTSLERTPITTSQFLRDALFMLAGLETTLFDSTCAPVTTYQIAGLSWDTHKALATAFGECGHKLLSLRAFANADDEAPLLQVFRASVQKALYSLDQELAAIQGRVVEPKEDVVVSPMAVLAQIGPSLTPLYALSSIVRNVQDERNPHAFRYLELLFDAVGTAQLEGSRSTYRLLGGIFFDCFRVYLRPIRLWMEEGRLLPGDRTFFVSESPTKLPLPQIWKSQFNLLRTPEGNLHAPRFLRPAINRILTAGKSIVVLKRMKHYDSIKKHSEGEEPCMEFDAVCPETLDLAPFPELFNAAFDAWIQSKHHTASATLRELLFTSYGLSQGLDALHHVYLMSDGSRSGAFASAVFRHLDNLTAGWKDRFTLTEIAQEALSGCVDGYRLFAEIDPRALAHSALDSRSSVRLGLAAIRLIYRLDWPLQLVVTDKGIQGYQTIFTFLLQIHRALSVLQYPNLSFHTPVTVDRPPGYYLLRSRLLWFCTTLMTYLVTLVLEPQNARLKKAVKEAADVDDMIAAHSAFIRRVLTESCLISKLQPIRDGILDIFDLAIRAEDAQRAETTRLAEEEQEISRLSTVSSPYKTPRRKVARPRPTEEDDEAREVLDMGASRGSSGPTKPHTVVLREMNAEFDRNLRFVTGGLRGVARASRDEAASKWDMLAEMLELGVREEA